MPGKLLSKFLSIELIAIFFQILGYQDSSHFRNYGFSPGNYYEFGTGGGNSLRIYLQSLHFFKKVTRSKIRDYRLFLFDSFEGLPEFQSEKDVNPSFHPGQFAGSSDLIANIANHNGFKDESKITLVKGWYESSLTGELRERIAEHPPSIVNIDVDYYSSALTILKWIEPILQNGTVFYFDDIWDYFENPSYGELAAIREFNSFSRGSLVPYHGIYLSRGRVYIFSRKTLCDPGQ